MFILPYWYDQRTGITFTGSLKIKFGHTQISALKIGITMSLYQLLLWKTDTTMCSSKLVNRNLWRGFHNLELVWQALKMSSFKDHLK